MATGSTTTPDNRTGRYVALRCSGKKRNAASCPLSKQSYDGFMTSLVDLIRRRVLTEDRLRQLIEDVNELLEGSHERIVEERRRLMKEIAAVNRTIDRLVNAVEQGQGLDSLRERLAAREAEKAELARRQSKLTVEEREARPLRLGREAIRAITKELKVGLESAEPDLAREVLQGLVNRVTLWNDKARVEFSLPPAPVTEITHDLRSMLWRARGDSNPRSPA